MIVFGGSGPIHGAHIARKLRIPRVICPSGAGVMSAFGLLSSPLGFEQVQSLRVHLADLTADRFAAIVDALESRVRAQLASAGGDADGSQAFLRLDMRYEGQGYEVEVAAPAGDAAAVLAALPQRFAEAYSAIFGTSFNDRGIEIVAWKVAVQGEAPGGSAAYRLRTPSGGVSALRGRRPAYFVDGYIDCAVYDRYGLAPGARVEGPALIEEAESTCVLAPGDVAQVDADLNLVIDIGGQSA
jgi:N-methylhydantoinase A